MARYSSKDCVLLIDGFSVLGVTTELTHAAEAITEESTAMGDSWATHLGVGINRADMSQSGFYDDDANSIHAALNEQQGVSRLITVGLAGNVIGRECIGHQGLVQVNYNRIASVNSLHRADARYELGGAVEEGRILHALMARTANGDTKTASVDNGAATNFGGAAYLHVTNVADCTNIIVEVEHSINNVDWDPLVTFAAVVPGRGSERLTVAAGAASVRQYLAVSWTFTVPGAAPTAAFLVGFSRYTA